MRLREDAEMRHLLMEARAHVVAGCKQAVTIIVQVGETRHVWEYKNEPSGVLMTVGRSRYTGKLQTSVVKEMVRKECFWQRAIKDAYWVADKGCYPDIITRSRDASDELRKLDGYGCWETIVGSWNITVERGYR